MIAFEKERMLLKIIKTQSSSDTVIFSYFYVKAYSDNNLRNVHVKDINNQCDKLDKMGLN